MPRRRAGELLPLELEILSAGARLRRQQVREFHGFLLASELATGERARGLLGHGTPSPPPLPAHGCRCGGCAERDATGQPKPGGTPAVGRDMSHAALDRARRLSLLLCELAALVAPPAARGRVVDERRSHLHESAAAGVSGASELLRALRGCLDDLRTCLSTRAASGATPLRVAMFTDAATSIAVSGLLIGVFAPTLPAEKYAPAVYVGRVAITLASIVLFGGYATRGVRRLRSRRSSARGD